MEGDGEPGRGRGDCRRGRGGCGPGRSHAVRSGDAGATSGEQQQGDGLERARRSRPQHRSQQTARKRSPRTNAHTFLRDRQQQSSESCRPRTRSSSQRPIGCPRAPQQPPSRRAPNSGCTASSRSSPHPPMPNQALKRQGRGSGVWKGGASGTLGMLLPRRLRRRTAASRARRRPGQSTSRLRGV